MGWLSYLSFLNPEVQLHTLKKYIYIASSGLLGGVAFSIKFTYRAVGKGRWHQDRRPWRMMSPFIALTVAFVIGALIDGSFMKPDAITTGSGFVSVGFISGYFADRAVGKMSEIANVIFGPIAKSDKD